MENILGVVIFLLSFLLIRIIVVLNQFIEVFIEAVEKIFTVVQGQSNKLVVIPLTYLFAFISNGVGFLFRVVHLNKDQEHVT